ncbi:MAG TPA: FmdB family zinc ribbon protein [Ktedonobacteraceae bacterium]|nr:FmdB family zinc ribbon protein [Ktedonobacteraceae bacterium]
MPTYEYLCQTCNHRFETWQKMTDEPLTICDECGGHIRRVIFPPGIVFKGTGFYKTDHRNGAVAATNGSNGKSETKPAETTTSSTSSESKPAESNSNKSSTSDNKAPAPVST